VTRETSFDDDVTDKRLPLLVSLVVVLGGIALLSSVAVAWYIHVERPPYLVCAGIIGAIAVGSRTQWRMRILSHTQGNSWPEVGVLVGLVLMPPVWVIVCTGAAVAISKATLRPPLHKALWGIAKDVLAASAAGLVFTFFGAQPSVSDPQLRIGVLALAALAMWLVDEALSGTLFALATRVRLRDWLRADWDMRVLATVARLVMAVLVVAILSSGGDPRLLLLVLPIMVCVHLWQTAQIRSREERQSWQRLAQTTD